MRLVYMRCAFSRIALNKMEDDLHTEEAYSNVGLT